MGLETGTFVSDLVATNPLGTDVESQGANHLRLIKLLLQNTFPGASKAWPFPTSVAKTANYSVAKADFNTLFTADTTGGKFTFTLPTLAAGDAGWSAQFMKINAGTNPFFLAPPSGTLSSGEITGLSTSRRSIPLRPTTALWTGSQWVLTRVPSVPIGSFIPWSGGVPGNLLPVGYEYPNGQTLSTSDYPDYVAAIPAAGLTYDLRGRVPWGKDNMGGSAAGRITTAGGGVDGATQGAVGGNQSVTVGQTNLPNIQSTISGTASVSGSASVNKTNLIPVGSAPSDATVNTAVTVNHVPAQASGWTYPDINVSVSSSGSISGNVAWPNIGQAGGTSFLGSGTAMQTLPPMLITEYLLVVE